MDEDHESQETGRYPSGELPSLIHIMAIRAEAAKNYLPFSGDDVSAIRRKLLQPSRDSLVKSYHEDQVIPRLVELQKSLEPIGSPNQLTARFIIQTALRNIDRSIEMISSRVQMSKLDHAQASGSFVIMCDFFRGIVEVAESILVAEEYLAHGDDILVSEIDKIGKAVKMPTGEQANLYIALGSDAKTYAEILRQDPSGFTLVERAAKDVETEGGTIEAYRVPVVRGFMIEGAKAGSLMYKTLYPSAQKILQQ